MDAIEEKLVVNAGIMLGMRRREELDYDDPRYPPPWRRSIVYSLARDSWENAAWPTSCSRPAG